MRRLWLACVLALACLLGVTAQTASAVTTLKTKVMKRIGNPDRLSTGARAWLEGPATGPGGEPSPLVHVNFGTNVDAANPVEDLAAGQAETAIAAGSGQHANTVLVDWNDASGFLVPDSTRPRATLLGVGLSRDGGKTFRDLVGPPNGNPNQQWFGDPSVVAVDGGAHFIVGSLYLTSIHACEDGKPAQLTIAVSVVTPTRAGATFTRPIRVADAGNLCSLNTSHPDPNLAFLDKDWLAYDPGTRTLAVSYTRFFLLPPHTASGQIEIARAHVPTRAAALTERSFSKPVVVWPEEKFIQNEGAYVALAPGGDAYVGWERNWVTNLSGIAPPVVFVHLAKVPAGASRPSIGSPAHPVIATRGQMPNLAGGVRSLDSVAIAGYNRGIGNDFPRLAWNAPSSRLELVWNDASHHPLGDIWLREYDPSLRRPSPVRRLNDDQSFALHFLPAVSVRADGAICSSWYDRRTSRPDSALTDYFGECRASAGRNGRDFRITTGSTDWANTSTLTAPNFGDYTDQRSVGNRTFYTWTDGRIGVPQPFADSRR